MARSRNKEHDSIRELMTAVGDDVESDLVNDILLKDVAPIVEQMLLDYISYDIYDAYEPVEDGWMNKQTYQRRYSLLDRSNLRSWILEGGVLAVTSTAVPDGPVWEKNGAHFYNMENGGFLAMLQHGDMGFWSWSKGILKRPALGHAQLGVDQSLNSGAIKRAIDNGIKRRSR